MVQCKLCAVATTKINKSVHHWPKVQWQKAEYRPRPKFCHKHTIATYGMSLSLHKLPMRRGLKKTPRYGNPITVI